MQRSWVLYKAEAEPEGYWLLQPTLATTAKPEERET